MIALILTHFYGTSFIAVTICSNEKVIIPDVLDENLDFYSMDNIL